MVRPTGIELVSSAPQADTLSIELWARKSLRNITANFDYSIILTFFLNNFKNFSLITQLFVYSIILRFYNKETSF